MSSSTTMAGHLKVPPPPPSQEHGSPSSAARPLAPCARVVTPEAGEVRSATGPSFMKSALLYTTQTRPNQKALKSIVPSTNSKPILQKQPLFDENDEEEDDEESFHGTSSGPGACATNSYLPAGLKTAPVSAAPPPPADAVPRSGTPSQYLRKTGQDAPGAKMDEQSDAKPWRRLRRIVSEDLASVPLSSSLKKKHCNDEDDQDDGDDEEEGGGYRHGDDTAFDDSSDYDDEDDGSINSVETEDGGVIAIGIPNPGRQFSNVSSIASCCGDDIVVVMAIEPPAPRTTEEATERQLSQVVAETFAEKEHEEKVLIASASEGRRRSSTRSAYTAGDTSTAVIGIACAAASLDGSSMSSASGHTVNRKMISSSSHHQQSRSEVNGLDASLQDAKRAARGDGDSILIQRRGPATSRAAARDGSGGDNTTTDAHNRALRHAELRSRQETQKIAASLALGEGQPSLAPALSSTSSWGMDTDDSTHSKASQPGPSLAPASSWYEMGMDDVSHNNNTIPSLLNDGPSMAPAFYNANTASVAAAAAASMPGAFSSMTPNRNEKEKLQENDAGPSLAPAQSNVVPHIGVATTTKTARVAPAVAPAMTTPPPQREELQAETGIAVGAFAIRGVDDDDDDDEEEDVTASNPYQVETGIPLVMEEELAITDAQLASEEMRLRDEEAAFEAELQVVVDGVVAVDDSEEFNLKATKRLRRMQFAVFCFSIAAVALIVGTVVGFSGGDNSQDVVVAPPLWLQVGADVFGSEEEFQVDFGQAVAMSGDGTRLAVSAPGSDHEHVLNVGEVRILDETQGNNGTEWKVTGILVGEKSNEGAELSISLSESGRRLAVGHPMLDDGTVKVYDEVNQDWTPIGNIVLNPNANVNTTKNSTTTWFGYSVDLTPDGMTLVVGAPKAGGKERGLIRIYQYDEQSRQWIQLGDDIVGEGINEFLGWSVAVAKTGSGALRVAAGGPVHELETGIVRVLDWSGKAWEPVGDDATVLAGVVPLGRFGESVALSKDGSILAVGDRGIGFEPGQVVVFRQTGSSWVADPSTNLEGHEPAEGFGSSVALSSDGSILAVGAPQGGPLDSGRVQMLQYMDASNGWVDVGPAIGDFPQYQLEDIPRSALGYAVAMSLDGTRVLVGAPSATFDGSIAEAGMVRVYDRVLEEETEVVDTT